MEEERLEAAVRSSVGEKEESRRINGTPPGT